MANSKEQKIVAEMKAKDRRTILGVGGMKKHIVPLLVLWFGLKGFSVDVAESYRKPLAHLAAREPAELDAWTYAHIWNV